MLLSALSHCKVPVSSLMLEFGYILAKHHFPAPAWQPDLSKEPAYNNWGSRLTQEYQRPGGSELEALP